MKASSVGGRVGLATPIRHPSTPGVKQARVAGRRRLPAAVVTEERAALELTKMQPLGDRVLVKPFGEEDASAGGVLLPKSALDQGGAANFGEVLAVGDDVELAVQKGDKVIYSTDTSAKVDAPDGEIYFLPESSVLAKIS